MTTVAAVAAAVRLSRELPRADIGDLAAALLLQHGLSALQSSGTQRVRDACTELRKLHLDDTGRSITAGALLATLEPDPAHCTTTPVWTGPQTGSAYRLTSAVVVDLIAQAVEHVLLVGYAVHNELSVAQALNVARSRGVNITLVLERHNDNPLFSVHGQPFPDLEATRLCWPQGTRPAGASLHAKILVVDNAAALVGSANITGAALGKNLECGLLIKGGDTPRRLRQHVAELRAKGHLEVVG